VRDAIEAVGTAAGIRLRLVRPLQGGEQGGALLVEDADGLPLVVTLQSVPWKTTRLLAAEPVMRDAVSRGWPAAAWLRTGRLPNGTAYVVQEFVDGEPLTTIDRSAAEAVVRANRTQRGIGPDAAFDDSAQLLAVTRSHPWRSAVADRSSAGRAVVDRGAQLIRTRGSETLPSDDVVHGDLSASNLLRDPTGRIRFVDTETVGRGTRVRDLADLLRQCALATWDSTEAEAVLAGEARSIAGNGVFTTCLVAVSVNNLAWWAEHRTIEQFDDACARTLDLFDRSS